MNIKSFDIKYAHKGGWNRLVEMTDLLYTQKEIAQHFGISLGRFKVLIVELFGRNYDPRKKRAMVQEQTAMRVMIKFARENTLDTFNTAFQRSKYYQKAMEECRRLKIYL